MHEVGAGPLCGPGGPRSPETPGPYCAPLRCYCSPRATAPAPALPPAEPARAPAAATQAVLDALRDAAARGFGGATRPELERRLGAAAGAAVDVLEQVGAVVDTGRRRLAGGLPFAVLAPAGVNLPTELEARAAADTGRERATAGADDEWLRLAWAAVIGCAARSYETGEPFTSNDVWSTGLVEPAGTRRALAGPIRAAAGARLIRKVGEGALSLHGHGSRGNAYWQGTAAAVAERDRLLRSRT